MVTETQKWHVTGHIIDASPLIQEASKEYFEILEKERKINQEKEQDVHVVDNFVEVIVEENVLLKNSTDQVVIHIVGMVMLMLGFYALLRGIN